MPGMDCDPAERVVNLVSLVEENWRWICIINVLRTVKSSLRARLN